MKKSRKRRGEHRHRHGLFSGWNEYRHGGTPKLAKHAPIFRGDKRQHVIDQCISILRQWRLSPFENEAACRSGLRSALCLMGHDWQRADTEADEIVQEAFRLLGAKRPSWIEGQWQYTLGRDQCSHCLGPISDEDQVRGFRYCSDVCARSVYERLAGEGARHQHAVGRQAHVVMKTAEAPVMECQHCHRQFQRADWKAGRNSKVGRNKYCSTSCQHAAMKILSEKDCPICDRTFQPKMERQVCCSTRCAHQHVSRQWAEKKLVREATFSATCAWCSAGFMAKLQDARYCSRKCSRDHRDYSAGTRTPRHLSPPVFDLVFGMAA